jgi:hypothetical protein
MITPLRTNMTCCDPTAPDDTAMHRGLVFHRQRNRGATAMNLTAQPQELGPFAFTLDEMAAHSRVAATQYGPEPAGAVAAVVETTAVRVALYLMRLCFTLFGSSSICVVPASSCDGEAIDRFRKSGKFIMCRNRPRLRRPADQILSAQSSAWPSWEGTTSTQIEEDPSVWVFLNLCGC